MSDRLLLDVWRLVARHLDLNEVLEAVVQLLVREVPCDSVVVSRLDAERLTLETAAVATVRPDVDVGRGVKVPVPPRTYTQLLTWARAGHVRRGAIGGEDGVLGAVVPAGSSGAAMAGPLTGRGGLSGVLVLLSRDASWATAHEELVARLLEPLSVALANHIRLHELTRSREALEADKQALLSRLQRSDVADVLVGTDGGLRDVMKRVEQVAPTDVPVLLLGETGTGKEVIARALHSRSARASGPIVRVNCGAISPGLVDSELFGHERGSFTGAVGTRQGWFERADGGTLFLDEIGELPLDAQVRLLRVLQDGTFERVGGQRSLTVDVRIVAATHRKLEEMVAQGTFREDLWYRLSVFPITLPPLRERPEDIPTLAAHFAWRAGMRLGGAPLALAPEDVAALVRYDWPGNVRELAAVIERAAILGNGHELHVAAALGAPVGSASRDPVPLGASSEVIAPLDAAMREHIEHVLARSGGRVEGRQGAAAALGINPFTLRSRMRKLGIDWSGFRLRATLDPEWLQRAQARPVVTLDEAQRQHIERALRRADGRIEGPRGAAALLRINPHTLRARMRKLGLEWQVFRGPN